MELLNTQKYYDVLGRNVNRNLKQKRALYRLDRMSSIEKDITMEGYIGSFTGKGCYKILQVSGYVVLMKLFTSKKTKY